MKRKVVLWIVGVLLMPFALVLLIGALLYVPPIQQWAVRMATEYASEATGMDIGVGAIRLRFPLDLSVERVTVVAAADSLANADSTALARNAASSQRIDAPTAAPRDTIAAVERVVVRVGFDQILSKRVAVNVLEVEQAQVNTASMLPTMTLRGRVGRLRLSSRPVDLGRQEVHVGEATVADADISIALNDTTIADTTESAALPWVIYIARVAVERTRFELHMPGDTMSIDTWIGQAEGRRGVVDLGLGRYTLQRFELSGSSFDLDQNYVAPVNGFDPNHLSLSNIGLRVDSAYYSPTLTRAHIRRLAFVERCGLELRELSAPFEMDTRRIAVPQLRLLTTDSSVDASLSYDLNTLADTDPGTLSLRLLASLGKQDIVRLAGGLPQAFVRQYPNRPLTVRASADGNMERLDIAGLDVSLPTALHLTANGSATDLTDSLRRSADIDLKATTGDLDFVLALIDSTGNGRIALPHGIAIDARLRADGPRYEANVEANEGDATILLDGHLDAAAMAYDAALDIAALNAQHYLPHDSLRTLSLRAKATGRGTDFLSPNTRLHATIDVDTLSYDSLSVGTMSLAANLERGKAEARLTSDNPLLQGVVTLNALLSHSQVSGAVTADIARLDMKQVGASANDVGLGLHASINAATDMAQSHSLALAVNDITIFTQKRDYRPKSFNIDLATSPDTTWAKASAGNLDLRFDAHGGYEAILSQALAVVDEAQRQIKERNIDQTALRELLPTGHLSINSGNDNPIANYLKTMGVGYDELYADLTSSPSTGVVGDMHLHKLVASDVPIDTITFHLNQGARTLINFRGRVANAPDNPQMVFRATLRGTLYDRGVAARVDLRDKDDLLGLDLGARAEVNDSGITVKLGRTEPVLGYKTFHVNDNHYIFLGRDKRVWADIDLKADDGTRIAANSDRSAPDMLQDMTVTLEKLNLGDITQALPFAPSIQGLLNGQLRLMIDRQERLAMLSQLAVDSLVYEQNRLGNIGTNLAYLLDSDAGHTVDAHITHNKSEVGLLRGTYDDAGEGFLDANFTLKRFPLRLVNGFVPDRLIGLRGYGNGQLAIRGPLSKPVVDGQVNLDSARLWSAPYGINMRIDDRPVKIESSRLLIDKLTLYSSNDSPLTINGNVDFANPQRIALDIGMVARDYLLIDTKKRRRSVAYGKAFVNFFGKLDGTLDMMRIRGRLEVLGKTDLTYIMTDTPLSTNDQLGDLVTFTDFRDTTQVEVTRQPVGGMEMGLSVNIVEGARIKCALNADESNYVNLEGGGDLTLAMSPLGDMQLNGRYTVTDGEMKYALPIIPLKTFNIKEGSYVEFTGEAMNPRLNLAATEELRVPVTSSDGATRSVEFECGVKVTQTLSNMGLEFTLDAPEDMTIKNELASMSVEERGKLAVTMLTTGMYLGSGSSGQTDLSMNSALNSFLQSQINNITSSSMSTVDLSLGMDQSTDAAGNTTTDYSFKFAKRLWNNRVNFVIGGKLSTSDNTSATSTGNDEAFIDNVSLEYRLDASSMRYVRLFYNKNAEDLLEGSISEYGAGFVWRKKLDRLSDLFRLGGNQMALPMRRDTTLTTKPDDKD